MARRALASLLTIGIASSTLAQAPIEQQRTKQLTEVAAQKIEADIKIALRDAGLLAKSDVAKSIEKLKEAVAVLEGDQALHENRKATLLRIVKDRLRIAELGSEDESGADWAANEKQRQEAAKAAAAKQADDDKKIKEGLAEVSKLRSAGKNREAQQLIADLGKKYPDHLAIQLLNGTAGFEKPIKESEQQTKDIEPRLLATLRDVDQSASPSLNDVEYPKDWKQRTAGRKDITAPNEEERKLLTSLNTLVDARWKNSRLQDVLEYLSAVTGRTIIADTASLNEANVTYETPINFSAREPISLRTALRGVLAQVNLTFVVRDGIIHVTSPSKARDLMTTKVYYLGDLITGLGPYGGAPSIGAQMDQVQMVQNVSAIVNMITSAVDPQSWESKNGQGHIGVNLPTLSLTIRQSQEVHVMLRTALYGTKK
jgi:hypothetical protein